MVRFFFAVAAAFLMLRRAAARCLELDIISECFFFFRVAAAFFAARERSAWVRLRAVAWAWRDKARWEAAERGSFLRRRLAARERARDGFLRLLLRFKSRLAWRRTLFEVVPFFGGGSFTPARRAFDNPIAMACFAERAPCSPSRICSISSRTNSPAWVEGDLPSRSSSRARSRVSFSGIQRIRRSGDLRMRCAAFSYLACKLRKERCRWCCSRREGRWCNCRMEALPGSPIHDCRSARDQSPRYRRS